MNKMEKQYLFLLRVFLLSAAVAWGVSVLGLILPWSVVQKELIELGAESSNDIMMQYWLKMAAAMYTLMGCFYIMVAIRPLKYRSVIALIGILHLLLGTVFLINGLMIGIEPIPLYVDVGFCFCIGLGIIAAKTKLRKYFMSDQKR